ncbi:NUDIX domain-containing protein [Neptuniibacter sp. QD37_6]|uniref:NUDIX domain-containing protein n=1 Tax=Neptuniibacter sp. QD37_6 TaxID=3398210 RepID=UPI0039F58595
MSSPDECVCFVVVSDQTVLFERRNDNVLDNSYRINIPGGHIEQGESQEQALFREIKEELGIIPLSYQFLGSQDFELKANQLLHYYLITKWEGEVQALEGQNLQWLKACKGAGINSVDQKILEMAGLWKVSI